MENQENAETFGRSIVIVHTLNQNDIITLTLRPNSDVDVVDDDDRSSIIFNMIRKDLIFNWDVNKTVRLEKQDLSPYSRFLNRFMILELINRYVWRYTGIRGMFCDVEIEVKTLNNVNQTIVDSNLDTTLTEHSGKYEPSSTTVEKFMDLISF